MPAPARAGADLPPGRRRPTARPARHALACLLAACGAALPAHAVPIVPSGDDEVVETLPQPAAARGEERRLRRQLAARPADARLAAALAARYMAQARETGDPRPAGQALAVLKPWTDPAAAPAEVLVMQATARQFLHDFDGAVRLLEGLVARDPAQPQAWLTLATIRRVQGRYAASDAACAGLGRIDAAAAVLYAAACRAENDGLRGEVAPARAVFGRLLADPALGAGPRGWLLTSLAELEERAGRPAAAEAAYKAALAADFDPYALTAYADFLIWQHRERDALALLAGQPRSDGVLLRLAVAGARSGAPGAEADAREMRERIAQANLRPQAQTLHAREQSMFALQVERDAARALELARLNVGVQREAIDLLVLAQAARAAAGPAREQALAEVAALRKEVGLRDRRLDALL